MSGYPFLPNRKYAVKTQDGEVITGFLEVVDFVGSPTRYRLFKRIYRQLDAGGYSIRGLASFNWKRRGFIAEVVAPQWVRPDPNSVAATVDRVPFAIWREGTWWHRLQVVIGNNLFFLNRGEDTEKKVRTADYAEVVK